MKDGRDARSFLARCRHWLEFAGVVVVFLPREQALRLGSGIGWLGWTLGIRRGQVQRNLGIAFPELDADRCRELGRRAARG